MKIVLLPGMDGTGLLFEPLLALMSVPCEVIAYSQIEDQSYEAIYTYVKNRIPNEPFYLVGESFSGPLAARLATEKLENLKGVIFVATFLSCPSKLLVQLAQKLPLKFFLKLPLATYFIRKYLIDGNFPVPLFLTAINEIPESTLKARLASLENLRNNFDANLSSIPTMYLCAENDLLVSQSHIDEFRNMFSEIIVTKVPGTHFLLQSNPQECAKHIHNFIDI